jgi:hypothetical protein
VKAFAALLGEDVSDLFTVPSPKSWVAARRQRADRAALAAARADYEAWCREKLITLTDKHRELLTEREILEIAYRYVHIHQNEITPAEFSYWSHRLAAVYDTLPSLEWRLDILTYRGHEPARLSWWLEERQNEQV